MSGKIFNKNEDKIALVVKDFVLHEPYGWVPDKFTEAYCLSFAVDQVGMATPSLYVNALHFPKVARGERLSFIGDGHLVYGPKNPGDFMVYSMVFMESRFDVHHISKTIDDLVKDKAREIFLKSALAANPGPEEVEELLNKLTDLVTTALHKHIDDQLIRRTGILTRDFVPPYNLLRAHTHKSALIEFNSAVIQLDQSNMLGKQVSVINL